MKKSPLNKVSPRRKLEAVEYRRLAREFLEAHPWCQVEGPDHDKNCQGVSEVPHHRRGRGFHYLDVSSWLATSNVCHAKIEKYRAWAMEKGYRLDRLGRR